MPDKFSLAPGQWFMRPTDEALPKQVKVFEGDVQHRKQVATITKMQALALVRWHDYYYVSYRDGNDKWRDVYVTGDIDAWYGDPD